jgi:hypothetical protein
VSYELLEGDCLEVLRTLPDNSFDACLTDPPYGLGPRAPTAEEIAAYVLGQSGLNTGGDFMGRQWELPSVAVWREVLRVCRPGAPVLAFAGAKTVDLMGIGMRAAGLERKDTIEWIQGQGMPKPATTTDRYIDRHMAEKNDSVASPLAKRWAGFGHALRPSHEPVLVCRVPIEGTIAENVIAHDVGGYNVPGCRVGRAADDTSGWATTGSKAGPNIALSGANYARERSQMPTGDGRQTLCLSTRPNASASEPSEWRPVPRFVRTEAAKTLGAPL